MNCTSSGKENVDLKEDFKIWKAEGERECKCFQLIVFRFSTVFLFIVYYGFFS